MSAVNKEKAKTNEGMVLDAVLDALGIIHMEIFPRHHATGCECRLSKLLNNAHALLGEEVSAALLSSQSTESHTMAAVPENSPLMQAWNTLIATPEFANAKRWAADPEHLQGSLWLVFMEGFQRGNSHRINLADALLAAHEQPTQAGQDQQESAALRDMLDDARGLLDMIRARLGVPVEPHQTLNERLLEAATLWPEPTYAVGQQVLVYDRYLFAIPLKAEITKFADSNDGVEVRLLQSNHHRHPVGDLFWCHRAQLRPLDDGKQASAPAQDQFRPRDCFDPMTTADAKRQDVCRYCRARAYGSLDNVFVDDGNEYAHAKCLARCQPDAGASAAPLDAGGRALLNAAATSGDEGAVRLAAQLAGVAPCEGCDYLPSHCKCKKIVDAAIDQLRKVRNALSFGQARAAMNAGIDRLEVAASVMWRSDTAALDPKHPDWCGKVSNGVLFYCSDKCRLDL
jgi:hypothetical protein